MLSAVLIGCHVAERGAEGDGRAAIPSESFHALTGSSALHVPATSDITGQVGGGKSASNETPLVCFFSFPVDKKTIFICVFPSSLRLLCLLLTDGIQQAEASVTEKGKKKKEIKTSQTEETLT